MLTLLLLLSAVQALVAYFTLNRTRGVIEDIDAQRTRIIELERLVIGEEIALEKALEQAANHFRGRVLRTIEPTMSMRDAVLVHPATREVFLAHRTEREKLAWDTTIAEFAKQNNLDQEELLRELKARLPW